MSNARATFSGEEIEVLFTGTLAPDWIGDPSVPNGTQETIDLSDIDVDSLTILGCKVDYKTLPEDLQAAILKLADDLEFEADEPDYPDYDDD